MKILFSLSVIMLGLSGCAEYTIRDPQAISQAMGVWQQSQQPIQTPTAPMRPVIYQQTAPQPQQYNPLKVSPTNPYGY